ncbi:hypothetical protein DFJ73DRAFT_939042 [Zopfochytrium polystomum]|nr:hypothetical protein DFJ73DRAFT_939042 [Zopfochytrium polystomum]
MNTAEDDSAGLEALSPPIAAAAERTIAPRHDTLESPPSSDEIAKTFSGTIFDGIAASGAKLSPSQFKMLAKATDRVSGERKWGPAALRLIAESLSEDLETAFRPSADAFTTAASLDPMLDPGVFDLRPKSDTTHTYTTHTHPASNLQASFPGTSETGTRTEPEGSRQATFPPPTAFPPRNGTHSQPAAPPTKMPTRQPHAGQPLATAATTPVTVRAKKPGRPHRILRGSFQTSATLPTLLPASAPSHQRPLTHTLSAPHRRHNQPSSQGTLTTTAGSARPPVPAAPPPPQPTRPHLARAPPARLPSLQDPNAGRDREQQQQQHQHTHVSSRTAALPAVATAAQYHHQYNHHHHNLPPAPPLSRLSMSAATTTAATALDASGGGGGGGLLGPLGSLGPDKENAEFLAKLEKHRRQKEYAEAVRQQLAEAMVSNASRAASAAAPGGGGGVLGVGGGGAAPRPILPRPLAVVEEAARRREKMLQYASTIKKPAPPPATPPPASSNNNNNGGGGPRTRLPPLRLATATAAAAAAAALGLPGPPPHARGTRQLRDLQEEHVRGLQVVERMRRELGFV